MHIYADHLAWVAWACCECAAGGGLVSDQFTPSLPRYPRHHERVTGKVALASAFVSRLWTLPA
jgi:hypothetical protein